MGGAAVIQAAQAVGQCKSQLRSVQAEFAGLKNNALGDLKVMARRITQAFVHCQTLCGAAAGDALAEASEMKELYRKECRKRKKLYNELQEIKGNLRVYCRVRPIKEQELAEMDGQEAIEMDRELGM